MNLEDTIDTQCFVTEALNGVWDLLFGGTGEVVDLALDFRSAFSSSLDS